jgi:hypothetical protein
MFTAMTTGASADADMAIGEGVESDAGSLVSYWVVGRLLTDDGNDVSARAAGAESSESATRAVYVCFEDGCPTDTVEYAFQIDWQEG